MLPTDPTSAQLIQEHGTLVEPYQREGGVWLERAPILINEDFDFALAMSLEDGVGAGLAAAKRKENNAQKAAALAGLTTPPGLQERLKALRCCGVHVYFVLWGAEDAARLRTVWDLPGEIAHGRVIEGEARPLADWAAANVISSEAQRALTEVTCPAAPRVG